VGEPKWCNEKILVTAEDPGEVDRGWDGREVDGLQQKGVKAYCQRHQRTLKMIATMVLVLVLATGIAGGVIWKLQRIKV
jgi:hypothetical protein